MKKFNEFVNENYKETKNNIDDVFNVQSTFIDEVFDQLVQIVCDVNHISEKDFKNWDQTKGYVEKYFDNNPEILQIIDDFKGKRYQLCAEFLYEKLFGKDQELNISFSKDTNKIDTRLPEPEDNVDLIVQ